MYPLLDSDLPTALASLALAIAENGPSLTVSSKLLPSVKPWPGQLIWLAVAEAGRPDKTQIVQKKV